jgi:hypothetical protein
MRMTVLAPVGLAGCAHSNPVAEERSFDACYSYVRAKSCGAEDQAARESCMTKLGERYAAQPDTAARRTMLVASGCPAPVVDGVLWQ